MRKARVWQRWWRRRDRRAKAPHPQPLFESFERRVMLSATFDAGILTLTGTSENDVFNLKAGKQAGQVIVASAPGVAKNQVFENVESIVIRSLDGNDKVTIGRKMIAQAGGFIPTDIDTGQGDDRVTGGDGDDVISTGIGNDTVVDRYGNNVILLGDGDDKVSTGDGDDIIDAGRGDDVINDKGGSNDIDAGQGYDKITTGKGDDKISAGSEDDKITDKGGLNFIDGGDGDDLIKTGADDDVILGGAGDDVILDKGGNNDIDAGDGNDLVKTGKGLDTIVGGDGDDTIYSNDGDDHVEGGDGDDMIDVGRGSDWASGGTGRDIMVTNPKDHGPDDVMLDIPADLVQETEKNNDEKSATHFGLGDDGYVELRGVAQDDRDMDFFVFTPELSGEIIFDIEAPGLGISAGMEVRRAAANDSFDQILLVQPQILGAADSFTVEAGQTYYLRLFSGNGAPAPYYVHLTLAPEETDPIEEPIEEPIDPPVKEPPIEEPVIEPPIVEEPVTPPVDEPVTPPVEEPVIPPVEEPVTPPVEEPVTPPVEEPVTPPVEEPVTPPVEEPVTPPVEEPVTPPVEEPVTPPVEEPVTPPVEEPVTPPVEEKPVTPPVEEPVTPPVEEKPVTPPVEEPVTPPVEEKPVTPPVEEPVTPPVEEKPVTPPVEEPVTPPVEEKPVTPPVTTPPVTEPTPPVTEPTPPVTDPTPPPVTGPVAPKRGEAMKKVLSLRSRFFEKAAGIDPYDAQRLFGIAYGLAYGWDQGLDAAWGDLLTKLIDAMENDLRALPREAFSVFPDAYDNLMNKLGGPINDKTTNTLPLPARGGMLDLVTRYRTQFFAKAAAAKMNIDDAQRLYGVIYGLAYNWDKGGSEGWGHILAGLVDAMQHDMSTLPREPFAAFYAAYEQLINGK